MEMVPGYAFTETAEKICKQELKNNLRSLRVWIRRNEDFAIMGKGKGKGFAPKFEEPDDSLEARNAKLQSRLEQEVTKVELIMVCRNTRQALGDKGSRIRLIKHKLLQTFGFAEDFIEVFVERAEPNWDDIDLGLKGRGKGKGRGYGDYGSDSDSEVPPPPEVTRPALTPSRPPREWNLMPDEWRAAAERHARLLVRLEESNLLGTGTRLSVRANATVDQCVRDRRAYCLRLWREYSMRKAPRPAMPSLKETVEPACVWGAADDWGAPGDVLLDWDTVPQKTAAGAHKKLVLKDFSDEEVQLDVDLTQTAGDVLAALREARNFAKGVRLQLVLTPSGRQLEEDFRLSQIPAGEELKFMVWM
ncbi:unnamed protein product [Effrenium voratum]|uniref:Uncharacterized protein n=1 Tax=Effrenium voratum TaxID=2562239 RepID=A0AA36NI88_9DINO|nr:unnamed protein product [Effrenium voratum]